MCQEGSGEGMNVFDIVFNNYFIILNVQIKEVIRQGVEVPENQNDLRRMQLRELAQLNGTLRENDGMRCNNCGASDHKSWLVSIFTLNLILKEKKLQNIGRLWKLKKQCLTASDILNTTLHYFKKKETIDLAPPLMTFIALDRCFPCLLV